MNKRILITAAWLTTGGLACESNNGGGDGVQPEPGQPAPATSPPATTTPQTSETDLHTFPGGGGPTSVRLTVKLTRAGGAEIVDAVELPGILRQEKDMDHNFLYEARDAKAVVAVQGLDVEFERHAVGPTEDHGDPQPVEERLVHVDLPGIDLQRARGLNLKISRLTAGHGERRADLRTFERLNQQGKLRTFAELRPAQLNNALATRSRRVLQTPSMRFGR